jgi:hypothetical protein
VMASPLRRDTVEVATDRYYVEVATY